MFKRFFLIVTFLSFGILVQCQSTKISFQKLNGISYVASNDTIIQKHIDPVLKVNANWTSIMPFGFMRNQEEGKLYFNTDRQWYGERVEGVKQSIQMMHKNGIKVMLKPQIWIVRGAFTGQIDLKTDENWIAFEKDYFDMLMLYAKLAQETKCEMLCIGTELNSFVSARPVFWEKLITEIRKVYSGKITYAENWDKIDNVPFWASLDFIGVDAYFPISEAKTPTLEEVKEKWLSINEKLFNLSSENQTLILFTEYGYRSIDYAGKEPWNSQRLEGQINEAAQAILLQGMIESLWDKDWFAGGFLWKWFNDPQKLSDRQANRFCVHGKIGEDIIRKYYEFK